MNAPRLSIIPAGAVTDRSLEPRDLQVLCLLGRHTDRAGWCSRSQVRMASELGCGRSSVQRSLDRLYDAGWVEKKRRDAAGLADDTSQPSSSYAYRVVLDRDDYAFENATRDAEETSDDSHAEIASDEAECPPVGTPGAQPDGHPGAQPERAPGAHTYVGTKNVPLERSPLERERDARARDRKARFIAAFEQRWPTAAADDRQRTGYAAEALSEDEEKSALDGIGPFLENLKRLGRKNVPAGWNYLEQKRWTLLEKAKGEAHALTGYEAGTPAAKALAMLYDIAGKMDFYWQVIHRDGKSWSRIEMTAQMLALADVRPRKEWTVALSRQGAGAWNEFIGNRLGEVARNRLVEGSLAPAAFPPLVDGTWSSTDPPDVPDAEHDVVANEGQRSREQC